MQQISKNIADTINDCISRDHDSEEGFYFHSVGLDDLMKGISDALEGVPGFDRRELYEAVIVTPIK